MSQYKKGGKAPFDFAQGRSHPSSVAVYCGGWTKAQRKKLLDPPNLNLLLNLLKFLIAGHQFTFFLHCQRCGITISV